MTDSKLAWMHDQTDLLNKAIQDIAAKYSFARFVPIDFAGHEVCTNESWVQTLNDKAPFHPTADGQAAYVEAITQAYRQ